MCCAPNNHYYMCHTCAKDFFIFELQLSSYWQNIKCSRYCPKFHIFTKIAIFQVYLQLFRPTAFHGRDMSGILFFIFASCEPLSSVYRCTDVYSKLFWDFSLDLWSRTIWSWDPWPYYGPGPLIILKIFLVRYALRPQLKSILLQEHIANMLLEQCAFQIIWSWSIFDSKNSFRL